LRPRSSFQVSYSIRALLALVGAVPWLLVAFDSSLFHQFFNSFCHQLSERSLTIHGKQMAVCSRCAGIYAGIALGAITPPLGFIKRYGQVVIWMALTIVALDFAIQNLVLHSMNHAFRIITGAMAGWMVSAFLFSSLETPSKS